MKNAIDQADPWRGPWPWMNTAATVSAVLMVAAFPVSLALANGLMLATLALWLLSGGFVQRWQAVRQNPVVWAATGLYVVVCLGVLYSPAPAEDVALHLTKYLKLGLVGLWVSLLAPSDWARRWALRGFAVAMGFIALSTWLNVWFQLPWSRTQNQGWGVNHNVIGDYITQNVMMAFFVLLALLRCRHAPTAPQRWAWAAMALLAAVSITHLSDGRTGYVLLAVTVGVFAFTQLKGAKAWTAVMVGALAMGALLATSDTMRQRFTLAVTEAQQHDTDNISSIGHRLYNYKTTPRLIVQKPWLGWGTGAYHTEICNVLDDPAQCTRYRWHPHNQYLFFAADHGLIGAGAYLALLGSMLWLTWGARDPQTRTLLLGLTVLLAVNSLFNSPLWSSRESHFFSLMLGLLASKAQVEDAKTTG